MEILAAVLASRLESRGADLPLIFKGASNVKDLKGQKLQTASSESISKFVEAAKIRNDEVHQRLESDISQDQLEAGKIKWHKTCYASYTSTRNVAYSEGAQSTTEDEGPCTSTSSHLQTRRSLTMTNWALCLICQKPKCKQEWETAQILTTQVYETLMNTAHIRKDDDMIIRILGEDLIALEAKYHKGCYKR